MNPLAKKLFKYCAYKSASPWLHSSFCVNDVLTAEQTLYLFEFFDQLGSFNTTLHIKADVHFDFCEGVSQFDDGNLGTWDKYKCKYSVQLANNSTSFRDSHCNYQSTIITTISYV